jgi:hypothetical protein
MILSNFRPLGSTGEGLDKIHLAEVVVTTSGFLWRKSEIRKVFRGVGLFWRFVDTGDLVPGVQCDILEEAHRGQQALARLEALRKRGD